MDFSSEASWHFMAMACTSCCSHSETGGTLWDPSNSRPCFRESLGRWPPIPMSLAQGSISAKCGNRRKEKREKRINKRREKRRESIRELDWIYTHWCNIWSIFWCTFVLQTAATCTCSSDVVNLLKCIEYWNQCRRDCGWTLLRFARQGMGVAEKVRSFCLNWVPSHSQDVIAIHCWVISWYLVIFWIVRKDCDGQEWKVSIASRADGDYSYITNKYAFLEPVPKFVKPRFRTRNAALLCIMTTCLVINHTKQVRTPTK